MSFLKNTLIIALIACLTGCYSAIFVAGATAGGSVVYDKRDFHTMIQDKNIAQNAQAKINSDKELHGNAHISVATFNGIVLLIGQARTAEQAQLAEQIVSTIPGIRRIYNEVNVSKSTRFTRRVDDTWITTKVKTAMIKTGGLHSTEIKVVTENGVVYLLGLVSRTQGNLAADAARRVAGVQKVVKVFEYQN